MTETTSFVLEDIHKTILRTVAYFASFSYPLTTFEVWKWQKEPERPYRYVEIRDALQDLGWAKGKLAVHQGHYAWVDGKTGPVEAQTEERAKRYVHAFRKERKLRRMMRWMRRVPFVEGIAVCNTLALHAAQERSDIDLFILTRSERVWTVRFLMVFPLMLLRARPGEAKCDPVDTNFFVSTDALPLRDLALPQGDPYFLFWCATLSPVLDRGNIFAALWRENGWMMQWLPRIRQNSRLGHTTKTQTVPAFGLSEQTARKIQEWKFPNDTRELLHKDTRVIANAAVLKFHKNDRRAEVKAAYLSRLSSV